MTKIFVTKSFLPPIKEFKKLLEKIWSNNLLTNQGPLLKELETKLKNYLDLENLHFVTNGTIALQLSFRALDITEGEIITTPFSYVATTSSILWERCTPIFVDIDSETLCIDVNKIEKLITPKTKAILAVHVFGYPCDVEKIQKIANKHKIKVIYDAAHAFGCKYKNKSLLSYGDISVCSFHATKVFNTIEGGCLTTNEKTISDKIELLKRFGHNQDNHLTLGINAKASEFQAAMGLCNIQHVDGLIKSRKKISDTYDKLLKKYIKRPFVPKNLEYNYSYYPVIFENESQTLSVIEALNKEDIYPRRYFYPSLNDLPYLKNHQNCPISEYVSKRILCLPLYVDLKINDVKKICNIIISTLKNGENY